MSATWRRVLLLALLVGWIGWRSAHHPSGAPPLAATIGPLQPDTLRLGRLSLTACEIGNRTADAAASVHAYCASLPVPEDYSRPAGRQINLRLAIVKADGATPAPDLVTFLDGGPGGAASDDYPALAAAFEPLQRQHHILLLDQRGTGGSNALSCPQPRQEDSATALAAADNGARAFERLRQCLQQLAARADVAHYTTSDARQDLETARQALGAPPLDLIGISYGTRLAQQYAAHYPQAVRTVVLDGPVPNALTLLSEHASNLEQTLRDLSANCRADAACAQRFVNPYATLYRLRATLRAHPQPVQLRDPVSFAPLQLTLSADDLAAIVRFYVYNPVSAALLPLMLKEADSGNYAPLLGQKKWLAEDLSDHITGGLELSVVCTEDAPLLAPREEDAQSLLGNSLIRLTQQACAFWPHGAMPAGFHAPWISSLPTLVLAGQYDPVTPPRYGTQIVATLAHARLLTVRGQGHGVIGVGCMPQLLARFIESANVEALDARCLERLGATPAFLDYNGAAP